MDQLHEPRRVYTAAAACVALAQVYFLTREQRADKVYLLTSPAATNERYGQLANDQRTTASCRPARQILIQNKTNLPNLEALLRRWYALSFATNTMLTLKYLILCTLDAKSMQHYRFLDCYLLGRVSFSGRIANIIKYGGLSLVGAQVAWRVIMLVIRPNLNFDIMEFLMQPPSRLAAREVEKRAQTARAQLCGRLTQGDLNRTQLIYSSLNDYKNPFMSAHGSPDNDFFIRTRPNRTLAAWRSISRILMIYITGTLACLGLALLLYARMNIAMVITKLGFRLTYRHCVEWVREQPNKHDYEFIYAGIANETGPQPAGRAFLPLEGFIEPNAYQLLRVCADALESFFILTEAVFIFGSNTAIALMLAADMRFYCRAINKRAERLIERLTSGLSGPRGCSAEARCQAQMLDIQASTKDFFAQVGNCNSYPAMFTLFSIVIWFIYSAICASWLFVRAGRQEAGKFEWYAIQSVAVAFIGIIIGSFNTVRHESGRLYISITRLASLDSSRDPKKVDRWLCLMRHYSPKPLTCFTIFGASQISWLLGLKALAWLASALFVASGFFGQP